MSAKKSMMMSMNSENGGGSIMFSDMDLSERLVELREGGEAEEESCRGASKMFSSSISSSLFLHIMEEIDIPTTSTATTHTKYNDISCAPITLTAALGAAVHQSCVDLPEQDFDEDILHMTASFQKQMSVSSAASEDELNLLKGISGHCRAPSFQLFDIDSFAAASTSAANDKKDRKTELLLLDSPQEDAEGSSVSSSDSTEVATNEANKPRAVAENDPTATASTPFVFPDSDSLESGEKEEVETEDRKGEQDDHDEPEEEVKVVGVVRATPRPHNTQITSPTPVREKFSAPIELNWVTPSESRPAVKVLSHTIKQVEDYASRESVTGHHRHHHHDDGRLLLQRGSPDMTGTTGSLNDSFTTCASDEQEEHLQEHLYRYHHGPQPSYAADHYNHPHLHHHQPSEYYHDYHPHQSHWTAPQQHPTTTSPTPSCQCDNDLALPDEYILAAERLRESMARSRMSRTAVVRQNSSESVSSSSRTANSGALLRERHLPQSIRTSEEMHSAASPLPPALVTPVATNTMAPAAHYPHHQQQQQHPYHYNTMNAPVMEPSVRFLRTDGSPAFPQQFYY